MSRLVLLSPSKLNLYLKVQSKRPDGFHDITTVFERINLVDEMEFRVTPHKGIRIVCDHPHVPRGPKNLVYQAARLLQEDFSIKQGIEIRIQKNIPVAAGLAGGSGNAATALLGISRSWKIAINRRKLLTYARKIGSDVAFFLYDASWAIGTGRGDRIKKLNINTKLWHILVVPRVKLYSGEVYKRLNWPSHSGSSMRRTGATNLLTKIDDNVNILIRKLKKDNILAAGKLIGNDLESVVLKLCPRLRNLRQRLKSLNTMGVMVSGSGPSVFGITATEKEAQDIRSVLSKRYSRVFVVRTL